MIALTIYSRPGCHLCDDMKAVVRRTAETIPLTSERGRHFHAIRELEARYGLEIPVLLVNGRKAAKYRVTEQELLRILERRR